MASSEKWHLSCVLDNKNGSKRKKKFTKYINIFSYKKWNNNRIYTKKLKSEKDLKMNLWREHHEQKAESQETQSTCREM